MENLLTALRQKTGSIHQELHSHPILVQCQEMTLTKEDYIQMLMAFYAPWKTLRPAIDELSVAGLDMLLEKRYQALKSDLIHLNVTEELLACYTTNTIDKSSAIGIAYVLIGSSIGAKQLQAKISTALEGVPISYLSMSPKDAGWVLFADYLKGLDTIEYPKAVTAAVQAFRVIKSELSKPLVIL